ncbi:hypothetical protein ACTFPK_08560 [Actinotignum sp. UMB0459]|uniref:hypothetical protein n=1 Tax=Actinotignum sp. UMB0459 TaxID=3449314 RepID=UPI003F763ADB
MTDVRTYAVLTPFDSADTLAALCALHGLDVQVVATHSGALVYRQLATPVYDEWDIRNITGPDPDEEPASLSDDAPAVAGMLSRLSPYGSILIDVNLDKESTGFEPGVSGMVRARRFFAGKADEEIASGLLLNSLDPIVEELMLGERSITDCDPWDSAKLTQQDIEKILRKVTRGESAEGMRGEAGEETAAGDCDEL